ncbi:HPAT1 [Auxenochlorella protothecoides x Auxenochlorella symbiontica]
MWLEQTLSSSRRRVLIILTVLAVTLTYSIFSVGRLSELAGSAAQREPADGSLNPSKASPPSIRPPRNALPGTSRASTAKVDTNLDLTSVCANPRPNTDSWGDVLVEGSSNVLESAGKCCAACAAYKPTAEQDMLGCNVWVYCEDAGLCGKDHKACWLKHLAHPTAVEPSKKGPNVGWTSGFITRPRQTRAAQVPADDDRRYHTVITAQGSAVHWQSRVGYYWFLKTKRDCQAAGKCDMGGFTRLLHSGKEDDLMAEIPTWVAQPLPPEHPDHGYVVLNRPYALLQWIKGAVIPEKYVLMSEPDHVWLKPMPNLMTGTTPAAFPFFYIEPSKKEFLPIVQKFVGPISRVEAEEIAPIGNAPTFMSVADMKNVMPIWFNISIAVHNDEAASKAWGWVQEMYAFTLSCYKAGIRDISLFLKMTSQPPWDSSMDPYYILHYTYGMDYTKEGVFTPGKIGEWRFDKRAYSLRPPPRNLGEPPEGMKNDLVRHLIHAINEASSIIPDWDDYSATGVAKQFWDGKTFATA